MKKTFKIIKACLAVAFSRASAYRADFVLSSLITLISNILFPIVTVLIYQNGASFPEWNMWEVLLIQSVYTMSTGVASMTIGGIMWMTMDYIRDGSFEVVLLKPISPLTFLAASSFNLESISVILGGFVMTLVSMLHLPSVNLLQVMQCILLFIAGVAALRGIYIIMAAITFKWVGNSRIPEIFESIMSFGKYPLGIFPNIIKGIATFVIPVAMIGYFPASALLGRLNIWAFAAIIPCILFMLFGIWLYGKMIKLYEGVGG